MPFEYQQMSLMSCQRPAPYNNPVTVFAYSKSILTVIRVKRKKHKSNAATFHVAEGGAVPTFTHQRLEND